MAIETTKLSRRLKKFFSTVTLGARSRKQRTKWPQPMVSRPEIYLPGHVWDSQNPVERYASVGDLCAHIGDQLPIHLVKRIARDVLCALASLHETRGKVHGDLSQDCILISPRDMKTLVSQFYGDAQSQHTMLNSSSEPAYGEMQLFNVDPVIVSGPVSNPIVFKLCYPEIGRPRHDPLCESYGMRPPEAVLDAPLSLSADIWTLGCVLYELMTGESLFDPFFQTVELGLAPEESHLIQIIELLGEFPRDVVKSGKNGRRWFNDDGSLRLDTTYYPVSLMDILDTRIGESEVAITADFLSAMLRLRPQDRYRAAELIHHPWFDNLDDW